MLGTQLVERDRQRVLMTPIGLEVANRARAILAATQGLVELAAGAGELMTRLLGLGVIPTVAPFLLPHSRQLLRQRYPGLRLALRENLMANMLLRLEDGQLDFALIALPYDTGNLLVQTLCDDDLWIVGRKSDPAVKARVANVTPSISDHLLLLEEGHCLRDHALHVCGASIRRPAQGVEAASLLTLGQMVESALGIGLVAEMAVRSGLTESPKLVARRMAKPCPKRTIALAARRPTLRLADLKALAEVFQRVNVSGSRVTKG